jgi:hypothetical protein
MLRCSQIRKNDVNVHGAQRHPQKFRVAAVKQAFERLQTHKGY